jgi:hypothetical protein
MLFDGLHFKDVLLEVMMRLLIKKNRGDFLEMIQIFASYNDKIASVVLENTSKSTKYTSHTIQKEILRHCK